MLKLAECLVPWAFVPKAIVRSSKRQSIRCAKRLFFDDLVAGVCAKGHSQVVNNCNFDVQVFCV